MQICGIGAENETTQFPLFFCLLHHFVEKCLLALFCLVCIIVVSHNNMNNSFLPGGMFSNRDRKKASNMHLGVVRAK